jgi:ER membrane protein complex subunit 7
LDYPSTRVVLNGGEYTGFVDNAGTFKIYVPKAGSYKLDVVNTQYTFEPVVVEITEPQHGEQQEDEIIGKRKEKAQIRPYLYSLKQGKGTRLVYPLQLEPSMRVQYFEVEQPFNPMVYLKNPMVIMVLVSGLLMFMMKRMPKQEMQEMQDMQQ